MTIEALIARYFRMVLKNYLFFCPFFISFYVMILKTLNINKS